MMKIAVTTASGQLGSPIINQLINDIGPDNVIGIARTPEKAEQLGIEIRNGTFDLKSDFEQATGRPHKSALEIISEYKKEPE